MVTLPVTQSNPMTRTDFFRTLVLAPMAALLAPLRQQSRAVTWTASSDEPMTVTGWVIYDDTTNPRAILHWTDVDGGMMTWYDPDGAVMHRSRATLSSNGVDWSPGE